MAKMIPPHISTDCKSKGEKLLFERFRTDPATENWIVLHSLGIARHPARISGEIDFIVIIPSQGVLCLEVKGGNVKRHEGYWVYGSATNQEKSTVGPFMQASDGMHAVRKYLINADPSLRRIMFFSGVLFTYIDFDQESFEWHKWQYADRSMLLRIPVSEICSRMLRCAHEHVRNTPSANWYDSKTSRPTIEQAGKIAGILRGDFECIYPMRTVIKETEKEIITFTEEQYSALDTLEFNKRIIFSGPAGTGKTFLALETARRSVLSGRKTLLICYNRLLGHWILQQTQALRDTSPDCISAGTLHKILKNLVDTVVISDNTPDFWNRRLPSCVVEKILSDSIKVPLYDMLIMDEAQDLLREEFLDVLDLLLDGGLAGGRWAFFGDFERQSIYNQQHNGKQTQDELLNIVKHRSPFHFIYPLRTNCRNTEKISVGLEVACRLVPPYTKVLHTGTGADIEIDFYSSPADQQIKLINHLSSLRKIFKHEEIVILSPKENSFSCAGLLNSRVSSACLNPIVTGSIKESLTGYATIQGFKGLEAPAVIITDIEALEGTYAEALLYVGMSRARINLVLIMSEKCRHGYLRINEEGLKLVMGGKSGKA